MLRRALLVPSLIVLVLAVATLGARGLSRRFLFPTHRAAAPSAPADAIVRALVASDGVAVHALELEGAPGRSVVVHFHNNSQTAAQAMDVARELASFGVGVVVVEYRGYGLSRGVEPSERGLYLDAEAALDMLARRGIGSDRIVLWGTSLGTGVAAEMARRGRGAALVLVTPYTSIPDLVTAVVPFVPARTLIADHFDTLGKSAEIRVPTLVVHGDADEIVPFWMGERIAGAIAGARLVRVRGGRHGDLFDRDRERLLLEIARLAR
jgi:fermentation-respiration switch protein FrsA (DUF1100 family)